MKYLRYPLGAMLAAALTTGAMAQDTPVKGGSLVYGVVAEAPTFDCGGSDTFAVMHAVSPFYSLLLKTDLSKYPEVTGDLAKSWTVSDDRKTITFELHSGVTFHDGTPLTSADVKATYDRYRSPPQGVVSFRKATFADIDSIETPSPTTVVFKLKAPNAAMIQNFASPNGCIYSAKKLAEDPNYPKQVIMGSGPFKFVESVKGSHISGERFANYFRNDRPYLDSFKAVLFTQSSAMINALQGGQILGEFRSVSPADRKRLQETMGDKITFYESDWSTVLLVMFNTEKPPFNDVRVRRALNLAIDRHGASAGMKDTTILRSVGGLMRPNGFMAADPKWLESLPGYARDTEAARAEARKLLKEAGAENLKFKLHNRTVAQPYTPTGVYLIDQWKKIGVEVEHAQVETKAYIEAMSSGSFDVAVEFNNNVLEDPTLTLTKNLSFSKAPENRTRANDPELDALFEKMLRESDPKVREATLRDFEKRAIEQAYQVPFLWWYRTVALNTRVKGWQMSPSHLFGQDLADVWLAPEK
jgi:peptide/nickel transport system substrate-binding protein